ncbi:MAG: DUF1513 domain-containing protein [Rhodobacteraceae bacterium]|nr:MAG: DUF1513 domain-containing protein [Paracoccaceae bacterium]
MRRRAFLASLLASASLPAASWADAGSPAYLAAAREGDGTYALFGLDAACQDIFRIPLPARGHAACAHPAAPEAVAFARRPGTFALVIDCATGQTRHHLQAPEGRHFYGHGVFAREGRILVTTENDIASGEGRLGLWDRQAGYSRIGEIASGGIGPHDILALPGDLLAVANGGIRTHPDHGRDKLNIPTMRPTLTYMDLSGEVLEQVTLDPALHKASIRHLAWRDGLLAFAMQWQGPLPDPAPLLGLHRRGSAPLLCAAPEGEHLAMQGYAGSVAISAGRIGITSPRGGRLHLFDHGGSFRTSLHRADICGLAAGADGLLATDGRGGILAAGERFAPLAHAARNWDNHLVRIV